MKKSLKLRKSFLGELLFGFLCVCALFAMADEPIYLRSDNELVAIIEGDVITVDGEKYDFTNYPKREKLIKLINQGKITTAIDLIRKFPPEKADELNNPNSDGVTPLMLAAKSGNLEEMKRIIGYGNEFLCDKNGKNAAIYAIENQQWDALKVLGEVHCDAYAIAYIMKMNDKQIYSSANSCIRSIFHEKELSNTSRQDKDKARRPDKDQPKKLWRLKYSDYAFVDEEFLQAAALFASDELFKSILVEIASKKTKGETPYFNPIEKYCYDFSHDYHTEVKDKSCSLLGLMLYAVNRKGTVACNRYNALPFRQDQDKRCALMYSLGLRLMPSEENQLTQEEKEKYQSLRKLLDTDQVPLFAEGHTDYYKCAYELNKPERVRAVLSQQNAKYDINDLISSIKKKDFAMANAFYDTIVDKGIKFKEILELYIQYADESETMKLMPRLVKEIKNIQAKKRDEAMLKKKREQMRKEGGESAADDLFNAAALGFEASNEDMKRSMLKELEMDLYKKSKKIDVAPIKPIRASWSIDMPAQILDIATLYKRLTIIDELLKAGVKLEESHALAIASSNNYCDVIRHFAKRGAIVKNAYETRYALLKAQPEADALLRELGVK